MEKLEDCLSDFEVCARRAIESILNSPTQVLRRFSSRAPAEDRPLPGIDFCSVSSGNDRFQVRISMDIRKEDLPRLAARINDPALRKDAIGEIVNTLAGNFLGQRNFLARYGEIATSLPFFEATGTIGNGNERIEGSMRINSVAVTFSAAIERVGNGRRQP